MAQKYVRGQRAWGICGRGGHKMLLRDMVFDGRFPNMRVDPDWFEDKHPQEYLPKVEDPTALYRPSPEVIAGPTAPVLAVVANDSTAQLTWTPAETDITEIASYSIFRGLNGAAPTLLITCAVLRDFLGGITGVEHCTTVSSIPTDDTSRGSVYDKVTNEDAPITYQDSGLAPGVYCYYVTASPMGNNQSVAQGPPSAPSNTACVGITSGGVGLAWTNRGKPTGNPLIALGDDGTGTLLAIDDHFNVLKSINGGHSWTQISTIPGQTSNIPAFSFVGNLTHHQGKWYFAGTAHADPQDGNAGVAISTDGGVTWDITVNVGMPTAGYHALGSNEAGTMILWDNEISDTPTDRPYALSTNAGATWSQQSNPFMGSGGGTTNDTPLWTGSEYVSWGSLGSVGFPSALFTNPDGQSNHWSAAVYSNGVAQFPFGMHFIGGQYVSLAQRITDNTAIVLNGAVPSDLLTATPRSLGFTIFPNSLVGKAGLYFVLGADSLGNGLVGNSADLVTWFQGTMPMDALESPQFNIGVYDSVNDSFVAVGSAGTVCTYP